MTSVFDVLAADDSDARVAKRKALALAHKRVSEQFDNFISQGRVASDHTARMELIRDDFREVVKTACETVGHSDWESIDRTLWNERLLHSSPRTAGAKIAEGNSAQCLPGQQHGIHNGTVALLAFLDASVDGMSARSQGRDIVATYSPFNREGWEQQKTQPVTVSVPHPEYLPLAVATIENSAEPSNASRFGFKELAQRMHAGEVPFPPGVSPEQVKVGSIEKEARKPKLCPYHSEVVDISLAQGEAAAGFNAMAQHAWGPKHCQSDEWGGDKCNFKPAMTTQSYWDEKKEKAEQRRQEREQRQQEEAQQFEAPQLVDDTDQDGDPSLDPEMAVDAPSATEPVAEVADSEPGLTPDELMAVAASFHQSAPPGTPGSTGWQADLLRNIGNPVGDAARGVGNAVQGLGQQGNQNLGIPSGGGGSTPAPVAPGGVPTTPLAPTPTVAPSAADIHKQFSQMGFGGGDNAGGYNPEAHSMQNYQQVADQMGVGVDQVQQGLTDFYARPEGNRTQEMAQQMVRRPGQSNPAVNPPAAYQQQMNGPQRAGSVHEAADPRGENLGPIERQKVDKDGEGPVPKMDKRKWEPRNFDQPIDSEHSDSPNPTERIDIQPDLDEPERRPQNNDIRHPQNVEVSENTLEVQDVAKDTGPKPERNNNGWAGTSAPKGDPTPFPA